MTFRERLLATLRAVEPVLEVPGVLVAGSEVPNLLEADDPSPQRPIVDALLRRLETP